MKIDPLIVPVWQEASCRTAALSWLSVGLLLAGLISVEAALFVALPIGAVFARLAVQARRRFDAIMARAIAAALAEHGPEQLAEAA